MLRKPIVGIIGFSDGDPEVHEELKDIVQKQVDVIEEALRGSGQVEVIVADKLVASERDAKEQAELLRSRGVDITVFSYGVFAFPNFSAIAARNGKGPFVLAANLNPDWPGMVAMLAAGGALNHLGIKHYRVAGDFHEPAVLNKLLAYARCGAVVTQLNGQKYGLIGGRSLGMYSAVVSMQDWQKQFGVDIEHLDQSEILRIGETIPQEQVDKAMAWLEEHVKKIHYDGRQLTPEKLQLQIRHYEAIKQIIREHHYDFVGVKCHYEMSRHYCTQCISAAFCNDPYDWDGPKEPVVYACEADCDAALTMQILKLLTHDPVILWMCATMTQTMMSWFSATAALSPPTMQEPVMITGRISSKCPSIRRLTYMRGRLPCELHDPSWKGHNRPSEPQRRKIPHDLDPRGIRYTSGRKNGRDDHGVAPCVCQAAL